jgi:hypothetical protein
MNSTTAIIVNAALSVLVIVALFRVIWFGIPKPDDKAGELRRHEVPSLPAVEQERRSAA